MRFRGPLAIGIEPSYHSVYLFQNGRTGYWMISGGNRSRLYIGLIHAAIFHRSGVNSSVPDKRISLFRYKAENTLLHPYQTTSNLLLEVWRRRRTGYEKKGFLQFQYLSKNIP